MQNSRNESLKGVQLGVCGMECIDLCNNKAIKILSDCNRIQVFNHLVHQQTLDCLDTLTKWLSVHLQTKWLWVQISSLKLHILHLFQTRSSLTLR